ncbi:hypothetical protein K7G19_21950 [Cupriavidus sp. DB3]|uniref:hypothetical protein n=1 Tax=Cupriavidus sp. DB3 TaxID=2873259 RepID=UPI001CF307F6|nr:hypothetical protein [Cupriavidus sp. DB3]MCA7086259.1 hypothetical protein [Cupriavidus sp. DB3]
MKVSYLNSMSTGHSHAAKDLFAAPISVPGLTADELPQLLDGAERLFLSDPRMEPRVKLEIAGEAVPLEDIARHSHDRQGAAILEGIAARLPRTFAGQAPTSAIEESAYYAVAALIASPAFWNTAETTLRSTLNHDTTYGEIRLASPAQLGMNVEMSKDGKSMECHLSAAWHEYQSGGQWHCMREHGAVLTANVKVVIPLKRRAGNQWLEGSFVSLHVNSPLPEIRDKLMKHGTRGFVTALLDALASIPLLGRLFRGVQIKVRVGGVDFHRHRLAKVPKSLGNWSWAGSQHVAHAPDPEASGQHIVIKKLAHRPNWIHRIHGPAAGDAPSSLRTLLEQRDPALRQRVAIGDWNQQGPIEHQEHRQPDAPIAPPDLPLPPPDFVPQPPLGPSPEVQAELEALRQTVARERRLREGIEGEHNTVLAERNTLLASVANLEQRLTAAEGERNHLRPRLEQVTSQYEETQDKVRELQAKVAKYEAGLAAENLAKIPMDLVYQQRKGTDERKQNGAPTPGKRGRAMTFSGPEKGSSPTVANNAAAGTGSPTGADDKP